MSSAEPPAARRRYYRAVVISPHLDDAVFSCGGTIARMVSEGPVLVLNLFTRYKSEVKVRGVVLSEARYLEEADAARTLGFESLSVGDLDVSFRRPAYKSLGNIFKPPVAEDIAWLPELQHKVGALLADLSFQQLYVPLGIGWHVDHVLAHMLFDTWNAEAEVLYYEDIPYSLLPNSTSLRLAELGLRREVDGDTSLNAVPLLKAWRQTVAAYARTAMIRNLEPWPVRQLAVPVVALYLYRLMALHCRQAKSSARRSWRATILPIGDQFELKLNAMTQYRSQFHEFFLGRDDCAVMLRGYSKQFSSQAIPAERFWQLRP